LPLACACDFHCSQRSAVASDLNASQVGCGRSVDVSRGIRPRQNEVISALRNSQIRYDLRNSNEWRVNIADLTARGEEQRQEEN